MRIALIERLSGGRDYLRSVFARHPEFDAEIVCWAEEAPVVSSRKGLYSDIPVVPYTILKDLKLDAVIVASGSRNLQRLLLKFHDEGVHNVYYLRTLTAWGKLDFLTGDGRLDMSRIDRMPEGTEKPCLVHLEAHVCDHCNLNCKACNHFCPFVKEPAYTEITQFETDVRRLSEKFSNIRFFNLLGGEPLLAPALSCEMIRVVRRYFPNAGLFLQTNGILISAMPPEFWRCLREHRVVVLVTKYVPVQHKIRENMKIMLENDVVFHFTGTAYKFCKHWSTRATEDAEYNNSRCGSGGCHFLRNGLVAKCPDALTIGFMAPALGLKPEELQTGDAIRLSEDMDGWEMIRKLDAPCGLCKKCSFERAENIIWAPAGPNPDPADWLVE